MGLWGSGDLPGKGHSGNRCDYCGASMRPSEATKGPHIGEKMLMGHNRYFCSSECLRNWRDQHQFYGNK